MAMKIYDVSVGIEAGMHVYPGDPRFKSKVVSSLDKGDPHSLFRFAMGNHTGTHVDAPAHFVAGGATVTDLPLEVMNGRTRVVVIRNKDKVDLPELQQLVLVDDFRVLFKTRNSLIWGNYKKFRKNHIYITEDAAKFLTENGVKLVGFDYLSVDRYGDESYPVHKTFLQNGVVILEGLNLSEVEEGDYDMSCLPLPLKGMDGAPARVILKK